MRSYLRKSDGCSGVSRDKGLPANCFTIGRFGFPEEGIELSFDRGSDANRPKDPAVHVGRAKIRRDLFEGCFFEKIDAERGKVWRAKINRINPKHGGEPFHTLGRPGLDELDFSILRVSLYLPDPPEVDGRALGIHQGIDGECTVIAESGSESLILLERGQAMVIFFGDGHVRVFQQEEAWIEEGELSTEEIVDLRIRSALVRVENARLLEDVDRRQSTLYWMLSGMVDLVRAMQSHSNADMLVRKILEGFFFKIGGSALTIRKRVMAVLSAFDPELTKILHDHLAGVEGRRRGTVVHLNSGKEQHGGRDKRYVNRRPQLIARND